MLLARGEQPLAPAAALRVGGWVGHLNPRVLLVTYARGTAESSYKAFIKEGGAGCIRPG